MHAAFQASATAGLDPGAGLGDGGAGLGVFPITGLSHRIIPLLPEFVTLMNHLHTTSAVTGSMVVKCSRAELIVVDSLIRWKDEEACVSGNGQ